MVSGRIREKYTFIREWPRVLYRTAEMKMESVARPGNLIETAFAGGERIGWKSAGSCRFRPVVALQVYAHSLSSDLNERVRHRAAFSLPHVQPVSFRDHAGENAHIKFFRSDDVIHRHDKMIEGLSDHKVLVSIRPEAVS